MSSVALNAEGRLLGLEGSEVVPGAQDLWRTAGYLTHSSWSERLAGNEIKDNFWESGRENSEEEAQDVLILLPYLSARDCLLRIEGCGSQCESAGVLLNIKT